MKTILFTFAELDLIRACLYGDCSYELLSEGGDYTDIWCSKFVIDQAAFEKFLRKIGAE